MRAEFDDANGMIKNTTPFAQGVEGVAWDVLPGGSGVIALEPRQEPQLHLVRGAVSLFPDK